MLGTFTGGNAECVSDFYPPCEIGAMCSVYYFRNCHRKGNRVTDLFLFGMVEGSNYETKKYDSGGV